MAKDNQGYKILLATDGSIPALAATKHAIDIAKQRKGSLTILEVKEQEPMVPLERLAGNYTLLRTHRIDGIEYAKRLAQRENIPFETIVREGAVAGEICRTASTIGADLIVMGSSNPRGLSGVILGDVTEAVLKMTSCSVLAFKPSQADVSSLTESIGELIVPIIEPLVQTIEEKVKFKVALGLFAAYMAGYALFTIAGAFNKAILSIKVMGLNLGILGGFGLITSAIAVAVFYNWYAGKLGRRKGGVDSGSSSSVGTAQSGKGGS